MHSQIRHIARLFIYLYIMMSSSVSSVSIRYRSSSKRFLKSITLHMSSSTGRSERTEVSIRKTDWRIDHSTPLHLVGSCFTDTISNSLKKNKFDCFTNGQGIMFNPISISNCLNNALKCKFCALNSFHRLICTSIACEINHHH